MQNITERVRGGIIVKKGLGKIAFILSMAVGLAACGSGQSSQPAAEQKPATEQAAPAGDQPVEIRLGGGFASEEPFWLMQVDPSLTPNQGKSYTLNITQFRANADRLNAYQANQIDIASIGQGATMLAASQGIPLKVIGSVVKDTPGQGFNTKFMALKDSGIASMADLKGKVIGIPDFKAPTDLWARTAVRAAGLDPDTDVKYAVIPIPSMGEAVKSKKIDVGVFPQPYFETANASGEFVEVFNSKTGVNVEEDFLVMMANPDFLTKNEKAVKDFLSDYASVVKYYQENGEEARKKIVDAGKVKADPALYVKMVDNNRSVDGTVNVEAWGKIQEMLIAEKWLDKPVDPSTIIDMSYLPK
jgi:ABC-type nitrate/sulfonate/bicarbonate transport system substrate-binding protein